MVTKKHLYNIGNRLCYWLNENFFFCLGEVLVRPVVDTIPESLFEKKPKMGFFLLPIKDGKPKYFPTPMLRVTPKKDEMLCLWLDKVFELKKISDFWKLISWPNALPIWIYYILQNSGQ